MTSRAERRAFFERSLADLDDEHAAGDLTDDDHARLTADYRRRLAAIDDSSTAPPRAAPRRNPITTGLVVVFVVVVGVAAGILVAQSSGRRNPGDTITGGGPAGDGPAGDGPATTATTLPDDLVACFDLAGTEAFDCYISYTRANPDDPDGFLYFGLYAINQGLEGDRAELLSGGETFLRRALELDPGFVEARANLAVVLERTGRDDEARAELTHLDGVDLPADVQALVDFVRRNLDEAATSSTTAP